MVAKKIIFLLTFLIFTYLYSQEKKITNEEKKINESIRTSRKLANTDCQKALDQLLKSNHKSVALAYKKGEMDSNNLLMTIYYWKGDYKKVLELSKKTLELAKNFNDYEILADSYRLKGLSYSELGLNSYSLLELHKALNDAKKIKTNDSKYFKTSVIYSNIARYHKNLGMYKDSTRFYIKKSVSEVNKVADTSKYNNQKYQIIAFQQMNLGVIYSTEKNNIVAEKYFIKSLNIYKNSSKNHCLPKNEEITLLSEMGKFYLSQKRYKKAIECAKKAKEIEKIYPIPYIRKDILETLLKAYVRINDIPASKEFSEEYINLNDSLKKTGKKSIEALIKRLLSEQENRHKSNLLYILIVNFIMLILIFLAIIFWRRKKKHLFKNDENVVKILPDKDEIRLLDNQITASQTLHVPNTSRHLQNVITISENTIQSILVKLDKFEKSKKFLKNEISLSSLSNSLQTNPRYLSEIIKHYKGKTFNNYINGLRIQYIIDILNETPIYREYKISHLATVAGFSSREVFAIIFKKETGVNPSYYISQLKKNE
ncbi:helix-turn-helix domain-containing protein [Chryseobacterium sp. G0201]|uniref:helix-turn-helix domain-containing protein n=1 Tax=Chryseobacterium sp. G0201 TaxID=2487065 RepID=UPI000F513572|nr:helix-turn-helix domain-containing protein [Chryseobacterium sp. G0201]AZA53962.1 helix-turn-helix domain-containing protein [Chryseobacterium sp. G0201]